MQQRNDQLGMTLIELTVVLLILIALAGLAIPYLGGTSKKALCEATDASMANIKKAIMNGYYLDTLGKFPQNLSGLTVEASPEYSLHYLFSSRSLGVDGIPNNADDRVHKAFDPDSAIGWRSGGYLQNGFVLESDLTTGNFNDTAYTAKFLAGHHFISDAWGRPIVLQVVNKTDCSNEWGIVTTEDFCARLVSAGYLGGMGLTNGTIDTRIQDDASTTTVQEQHRQNDDRLLYLNVPTPPDDINISCDDY
ncbi:hypothetical protein [Methylomarinum vadi]|uniref:hypothetical protein n=1 Tax=Methylomarinum vadi TaxID=438855 RepID=UPI0004DF4E71|nr:hypothetical protein [Methylomarinum vadi]